MRQIAQICAQVVFECFISLLKRNKEKAEFTMLDEKIGNLENLPVFVKWVVTSLITL